MKNRKQTSQIIAIILLLGVAIFVALSTSCGAAGLLPTAQHEELAFVDLNSQSFEQETLGRFTLQEAADVELLYILPNLDSPYFDLALTTPDGRSLPILHGEDYRTDAQGGGRWQERLEPGTYQLSLSAAQSPGQMTVYWKVQ